MSEPRALYSPEAGTERQLTRIRLPGVDVEINDTDRVVVSRWAGGWMLAAAPEYDNPAQQDRAERLGFGREPDGVWRLTRGHDLCHQLVHCRIGRYSPTLLGLAQGKPVPDPVAGFEERLIEAVERWVYRDERTELLDCLSWLGVDVDALKREMEAFGL